MSNTFDFEAFKANAIEQLRAGFAFIAPEPISSTTVIQIVIQIVIHDFRHLEKFIKFSKSVTQIATDRFSKLQGVSNSEFLIAGRIKTVIHIVIQKSGQNTKKPQQINF